MTKSTNERQLEQLWDRAKAHKIDDLFRHGVALVGRDRISATPDGYPPGGDGGRGGSTNTPTEGAVLARIHPQRDDVALARRRLMTAAVALVDAMDAMVDAHRSVPWPTHGGVKPEPCESCKRDGIPQAAEQFGTCAGRLERKWQLCESCLNFVRRFDRTPSVDELREHARSGRWRVVANPRDPKQAFRWADGSTTGITPTPPSAA